MAFGLAFHSDQGNRYIIGTIFKGLEMEDDGRSVVSLTSLRELGLFRYNEPHGQIGENAETE